LAVTEYLSREDLKRSIGIWSHAKEPDDVRMIGEFYLSGADLEGEPANRVRWHEARVRVLKAREQTVSNSVTSGAMWPRELNRARFDRLGAEADLLVASAEAERSKKK
jgi:hypothetical protein